MIIPDSIHPKILAQIKEKLFSLINFKAEEVKKTLITAALSRDSVENKAKEYHHKQRETTCKNNHIEQMLNLIKTISIKELGGRKV
ncbi:putative transposase [Sulfurisphaera tokodaii str. 7]|uniref:Transposase n=1 Tax=Sulfurisphaera tokodaii (strain DSM 16993 / JCM 10545 / NBRC 100140 / 7) TaxID=273063 RepID=F9VNH7_SULTO|nr:putative transposase [Sulfurisphaera tokodaii str. 7]